ncbi:MAG: RNA-binding transcriptional accessory protein [Planctomycetes bacterium]|nr:RNA-binding transcriptional accessory protein [Planctomycetota bacterium]
MTTRTIPLPDALPLVGDVARAAGLPPGKVRGAVELLAGGATVPFIARYRKERTGGLDETALRAVEDLLKRFRELAERREAILRSIGEQGKLDEDLRRRILAAKERQELEDLYIPFRPKRRTRASAARERGLEPLADYLRAEADEGPRDELLRRFVDPARGVPDAAAALQGACDILAEEWAERPDLRRWLRERMREGVLVSRVRKEWKGKPGKFETYYDFREPLARMPSHRYLAVRRGEAEKVLSVRIELDEDRVLLHLASVLLRNPRFSFRPELLEAVKDCFSRLLSPSIETEAFAASKEDADREAIAVFASNLRALLLAPPAGRKVVMGIDPGFRTGCKVAVVDATGKVLETATIYPTPPEERTDEAAEVVLAHIRRHGVELIAIGNGTGSREADAFVTGLLREQGLSAAKVIVNESGASVYSASEAAVAELPGLDVTLRGAVSIARRLQDPLAELVKIDPRSIGVGQYQHDVDPAMLGAALDREVASCVNLVGVELNTASARLLSHVSGIGTRLAEAIVRHRDARGPFRSRAGLLDVPRFGSKAFELSAGFLRITGGDEPLDASAVHPESYGVVESMARRLGRPVRELVGSAELVRGLRPTEFADERFGLPTVEDILRELEKPGRDPRRELRLARLSDAMKEIADLRPGMLLEGTVTNVTRFGAFVDLGVHQDGLIHVSELSRRFVKDPAEVVSAGDIVRVKVLAVDAERKRIALSRKQVE